MRSIVDDAWDYFRGLALLVNSLIALNYTIEKPITESVVLGIFATVTLLMSMSYFLPLFEKLLLMAEDAHNRIFRRDA